MDSIAISALVLSIINGISHLHLRRVHALCFSSECSGTPPGTPKIKKEVIVSPPSPT